MPAGIVDDTGGPTEAICYISDWSVLLASVERKSSLIVVKWRRHMPTRREVANFPTIYDS